MIGEEIYKQISTMLGECYLDEDSREKLVKYIESLRDSQCQTVDNVKPEITISMDEYKELLIIKGRYEELNSRTLIPQTRYPYTRVTYRSSDEEDRSSDDKVEPETI